MAYITAKEVKEKRDNLKKTFPRKNGWKFSVKREHSSSIHVTIVESPFNLGDRKQVNHFYIEDHFKTRPAVAKVLKKIYEIVNEGNFDESDISTDYFHVGFYVQIKIGEYGKPHVWNKRKVCAIIK